VIAWDGSRWSPVGGTGTFNQRIFALAEYADNLVAAGEFTSFNEKPANRAVQWTGVEWQALGEGPPWIVEDLLVAAGRNAYQHPVPKPCEAVATWDGFQWSLLSPEEIGSGFALATFDDGHGERLYVVGILVIGTGDQHVAKWTGAAWQPLPIQTNLLSAGSLAVARIDGAQRLYIGTQPLSLLTWDGNSIGEHPSRVHSSNSSCGGCAITTMGVLGRSDQQEFWLGGTFFAVGGSPSDPANSIGSTFIARWHNPNVPRILAHPEPASVAQGATAAFTVEAECATCDSGALVYQWLRDGRPICDADESVFRGAQTPTLLISAALPRDAGVYSCLVTNSCGTNESLGASLVMTGTPCPGDADRSGLVEFRDIIEVLQQWGGCTPGGLWHGVVHLRRRQRRRSRRLQRHHRRPPELAGRLPLG